MKTTIALALFGAAIMLDVSSVSAQEACQLTRIYTCKNRQVCAPGTHSAGHLCYQTFTDYTYWLFGAPMPTGKKCGCAPPPPPYVGRKFDDEGRPISAATQSAINQIMGDVDMAAVARYHNAIDQVQALLRAGSTDDLEQLLSEEPISSGCEE